MTDDGRQTAAEAPRWKRVLAWLLCAGCFLAAAHQTNSAAVATWVHDRIEILEFGVMIAITVAGITKTKDDDTFWGAVAGFLGQRFGGGK